jgi:uncharacterized protein (DUF2147 family)
MRLSTISILSALLLSLLLAGFSSTAQSITGKWKTIDDETGKVKSIIELYEHEGKINGRIQKLFLEPKDDPNPVCSKCSSNDKRYNKPIIGMVVLENLVKKGNEYTDGTILDPQNGKTYSCKVWLENGELKVRGYWGFLYRTQTWIPTKE